MKNMDNKYNLLVIMSHFNEVLKVIKIVENNLPNWPALEHAFVLIIWFILLFSLFQRKWVQSWFEFEKAHLMTLQKCVFFSFLLKAHKKVIFKLKLNENFHWLLLKVLRFHLRKCHQQPNECKKWWKTYSTSLIHSDFVFEMKNPEKNLLIHFIK